MAANPNGSIAIVFTYSGSNLGSYADFLASFWVTLPGGGGVALGPQQYFGYVPDGGNALALGTSYSLQKAATPITGLLPTNGVGNANLVQAFQTWAATQAASPKQTDYANLYLSFYTGGRVYLSNGALGLGSTGEPVPASPSDPAYDIVYDLIEPFIGAQVGSTTIPGNGADITDIDWFSFPITVKVWYYDFGDPSSVTLTNDVTGVRTIENGGSGSGILSALQIGSATQTPTNAYPSTALPVQGSSSTPVARRLAGPTAAATSGYYTDPKTDLFPYHYFDDYLVYLAQAQGTSASSFTLTGTFAGVTPQTSTAQAPQQFSFAVDFSDIQTATMTYPSGQVTQITTGSTVKLTGYTFTTSGGAQTPVLGSATAPFTIEIPWATGSSTATLQVSSSNDALAQGWLSQTSPQSAPSGTYSPVAATAQDQSGNPIPAIQGNTNLQLIFSVNSDPTSGTTDDLWQGGKGTMVSFSDPSGLTMTANAVVTQAGDQTTAILILKTDANGQLASIQINDFGAPSNTEEGSTWTFAPSTAGLNNNVQFVITLLVNPPLRNAFVLASASYGTTPAALQMSVTTASGGTAPVSLGVNPAGLSSVWVPDPTWTTLDQPAGIYGANTGYTISGIGGSNSGLNGDVTSLQNDVFGWAVADLLAALNVGFVGSPVIDPDTGKPIGQSPSDWFTQGNSLYGKGLWGAKAWEQDGKPIQFEGAPIDDFWNTWAYNLASVPGGTDAYGFAFTDRFAQGILVGFNPPPAGANSLSPVLLEVIVGDSPLLVASKSTLA